MIRIDDQLTISKRSPKKKSKDTDVFVIIENHSSEKCNETSLICRVLPRKLHVPKHLQKKKNILTKLFSASHKRKIIIKTY